MKKSTYAIFMALAAVACLSLPLAAVADTNVALGQPVTINGPIVGGTGDLITDGIFQPLGTPWNVGSVFWHGLATNLVIDLGGSYTITGLIVQADDNDRYGLDYWDGSNWVRVWDIPAASVGAGLKTRPNPNDNTQQFILGAPITTDLLRIEATGGDNSYSVAEVQAFGAPIPLPPTFLLLGSGLAGMLAWRRRRNAR